MSVENPIITKEVIHSVKNFNLISDSHEHTLYLRRTTIPQSSLVRATIQASLIEKFGLEYHPDLDGKIRGKRKGSKILFSQFGDNKTLGLVDELSTNGKPRRGVEEIFSYWDKLLRILLDNNYMDNGIEGGKLTSFGWASVEKVGEMLRTVLKEVGGEIHADAVGQIMEKTSPMIAHYITSPTGVKNS
jgi:hypothetical protein